MALDDIPHFGSATPAQRNAGAAMPVIMDEEFIRDRLGVETVGSIAIRPHAGDTCAGLVGIEGEIGRRQIGRGWHIQSSRKI